MTMVSTKKKRGQGQLSCLVLLLLLFLLLLCYPQQVTRFVQKGLSLSVSTLIPSLFPFLVLSRILVGLGFAQMLPRPLLRPVARLLGLSPGGCCALLLGWLCGFPAGASFVSAAVGKGEMTACEGERLLLLSSIPSMGFLFSAVGSGIWRDPAFGRALWVLFLLSALLTDRIFYRKGTRDQMEAPTVPRLSPVSPRLLTDAMADGVLNMLVICGYVVFFTVLSGMGGMLLERLSLPAICRVLLACILELSGGVKAAGEWDSGMGGRLLTAFAVAWSGLSVHCQAMAVAAPCPGRAGKYLLAKAAQGGFSLLLCWLYLVITK